MIVQMQFLLFFPHLFFYIGSEWMDIPRITDRFYICGKALFIEQVITCQKLEDLRKIIGF